MKKICIDGKCILRLRLRRVFHFIHTATEAYRRSQEEHGEDFGEGVHLFGKSNGEAWRRVVIPINFSIIKFR
jgi:hypothetical protein